MDAGLVIALLLAAGFAATNDASNAERIARRELYRRCSRIGETVVDVAERVIYAVMKQS